MEQTSCTGISNCISNIYYRSNMKSCNYTCYYCPFHKHKAGNTSTKKDKILLYQFIEYIEKYVSQIKSIVFTPYGEVLRYEYYYQALGRLSTLSNIRGIGCQTNLSFDIDTMVRVFLDAGGDLRKLRLWCTFHPTMVSVEDFLINCNKLMQYNIKFCVGAVGDIDRLNTIKKLHNKLNDSVYMWINKMDGMKRKYTTKEIEIIKGIDPFFELDLNGRKADYSLCKGGKQSVFVHSSGDVHACNISGKKLFNLYDNSYDECLQQNLNTKSYCCSKKCDCYISYSLRKDISEMVKFFPDTAFRIPLWNLLKEKIEVIFFDIDGTLAAKDSNVDSAFVIDFIHNLSKKYKIYVATSLPYRNAMKKCSSIKEYLSGGVFAGGAYIRDFNTDYCEVFPVKENVAALFKNFENLKNYQLRIYKKNNAVYKITFHPKSATRHLAGDLYTILEDKMNLKQIIDKCNVFKEDGVVQIVSIHVSKTKGILNLCNKLGIDRTRVAAIGDSNLDNDMMDEFNGIMNSKLS